MIDHEWPWVKAFKKFLREPFRVGITSESASRRKEFKTSRISTTKGGPCRKLA